MSTSQEAFDPYLEWLGIEPHEHPIEHYRLLGIARFESEQVTINSAADERMRHVRSFQTGPRGKFTQQLLNELATAKLCLLSIEARARYDAALKPVEPQTAVDFGPLPPPVVVGGQTAVAVEPTAPPIASQPKPAATTVTDDFDELEKAQPALSRLVLIGIIAGGIAVVAIVVWAIGRSRSGDEPNNGNVAETQTDNAKDTSVKPILPKEIVISQEANGDVHFPASVAGLSGQTAKLETQGSEQVVTNWIKVEEQLTWKFKLVRLGDRGQFKVEVTYKTAEDAEGSQYELLLDDKQLKIRNVIVTDTPGGVTRDAFYVVVRSSGSHTLVMRPVKITGTQLMDFESIRFKQE